MANEVSRYGGSSLMPLSEAMDQLFRDAFTWPRAIDSARRTASLGFSSNLYETDEGYIMQVLLPGAEVDKLGITARQNVLTIQGATTVAAPEGARPIWQGASVGEFREQVTLPGEVDGDKASADYRDGILTLTLPKAERARVKTIKVSGGATTGAIEGKKA